MTHFLWMHPWDLEGWMPDEFLDHLQAANIHEVRLALAYHGGRLLLPRNRRHLVYEQHDGAVYFSPDRARYGLVQPAAGPHLDAVSAFLDTAQRRRFPVRAWLVLCHNDHLGRQHPDLCIRNFRGEPYTYALCPSQPHVQHYIRALIADVSRLPLTGLDLEALSFMGYEHASLHDKRAVPPPPELDICHCSECNGEADRPAVLKALLDTIETDLPIDLRYTGDPGFYGGKTYLPLPSLPPKVASITRTFFGKPVEAIQLPSNDPVPANVGLGFHPPDTRSLDDLRARYQRAALAHSVGFYCYGLAAEEHWNWLTAILTGKGLS